MASKSQMSSNLKVSPLTVGLGFIVFCFIFSSWSGSADGFSLSSLQSVVAGMAPWQQTTASEEDLQENINNGAPLNILVFGGNGFMGGLTVEKLIAAGHKVVTVNRGNWYWDSAFVVKPYVTQVSCDRLYSLDRCPALLELITNNTEGFDAVVDFSAYHMFAVTEALRVLQDKMKMYVYISTDSVYDVCDKDHQHPSTETDSVRPHSQERRKELEQVESYGHRKLEIEEELSRQWRGGGVPYVSLRLPDVVGPKDNTYRWWIYQVWMKMAGYLDKPPSIPRYLKDTRMSLVYVRDVADVIVRLMTMSDKRRQSVVDNAYNLAFKETPTLLELLSDIKAELNISQLPIHTDNSSQAVHLFPSVRNGPVDIAKAQALLGFQPTPLLTAIQETVAFYEKAMTNPYYHIPRKEIIRNIQVHFTNHPFKVLLGLKKHYGLDFQMPKDEL